jgi:hypothetical protein
VGCILKLVFHLSSQAYEASFVLEKGVDIK